MRLTATLLATVAVAGLNVSAYAAESWNMATAFPDRFFHTKNINQFAKDVAEATKGDLNIKVHSASSLYKLPEIHRAIQTGQIQIGESLVSLLSNEDRIYEVDSLPFLASTYDEAKRLWAASKPYIAARLAKKGITVLYSVPWPPQGFYAKKELKTIDDFKGLKFRAYNATVSRFAVLVGAVPTTVQLVDIPQAFSTGIVDAMITSATTGVLTKSWDFLTHYHDAHAGLGKNMVIVSTRSLKRLSKASREGLLAAAARAEPRGWKWSQEETAKMTAALAKGGLTVVGQKPPLMKGLRAIGDKMEKEWLTAAGPDGQKLLDAYRGSK